MSIGVAIEGKSRTPAWQDWLQMLSGLGLLLFIWLHMILVSSVLLGAKTMNVLAEFFEYSGLLPAGAALIVVLFTVHFILAARKMPFVSAEQAAIWRQARMLRHADTWLWLIQVATALAALIFGMIHLWTMLTTLPITAARSAARIKGGYWLGFYFVVLPMIQLHASIGFYRILVKWGVATRADRKQAKRLIYALTIVFTFIGVAGLIRFLTLMV